MVIACLKVGHQTFPLSSGPPPAEASGSKASKVQSAMSESLKKRLHGTNRAKRNLAQGTADLFALS